jgi:hypothetical protein
VLDYSIVEAKSGMVNIPSRSSRSSSSGSGAVSTCSLGLSVMLAVPEMCYIADQLFEAGEYKQISQIVSVMRSYATPLVVNRSQLSHSQPVVKLSVPLCHMPRRGKR